MPSLREIAREHAPLLVSGIALLLLQLPILGRYGIHRDEMYFVECGRHLAAGYVDHPPLVPWIAGASCAVGGCGVWSLRLPSLLARLLAVALTVVLAKRLGGRGLAQLLAGLAVVFAPAFQRMGKILCIPVFEPVFWIAGSLLLLALIRGARPRLWLGLGLVVGLGLLNKHTMLLWAAGAGIAVLTSPLRTQLRTRWPWLGVALALAIWSPNLRWQVEHDWATLEFLRNVRAGMLADIPRSLFLLGQLLYMHPFSALLWAVGLISALRNRASEGRPFVWIFGVALGVLLFTGAKPYYLAPAYPALFAVGAIAWERWLDSKRAAITLVSTQVITGLATTVFTLPFFSLPATNRMVDRLLGHVVPAVALTHDLHDEFGWRELAEVTERGMRQLTPAERTRTEIVAANYGQAAAINRFGPELGLPGASSGHMTYFLWGPVTPAAETLVAVGLNPAWLRRTCDSVVRVGEANHPLALPSERQVAIHLCRGLRAPLTSLWPALRRFDHGAPATPR